MTGTREFDYPKARRLDLTEEIFGHQVSDAYRWMEEADHGERADWLQAQAGLSPRNGPGGQGGTFWPNGSVSC